MVCGLYFFKPSNHNKVMRKCPLLERPEACLPLRREGNTPTSLMPPSPGPVSTIQANLRAHTILPGSRCRIGEENTIFQVSIHRSVFLQKLNDFSLTPKLSLHLFVSGKVCFLIIPQKLHGWQAILLLGLTPQTCLPKECSTCQELPFSATVSLAGLPLPFQNNPQP